MLCGNRLVHGAQGHIMGPADKVQPVHMSVHFPGSIKPVNCLIDSLSRSPPPPLPGGFSVGDRVYYTGDCGTVDGGNRLVHGTQGELTGLTNKACPDKLCVTFPGCAKQVICQLTNLSRTPPAGHSPPEYPPMIQITLQGMAVSDSLLYRGCLGVYELQQGRMAHARPVWKQPGEHGRCIAYLGGSIGWGVQPDNMVGSSTSAWLILRVPELFHPCDPTTTVWNSTTASSWVEVEQVKCAVLGPPPTFLQLGLGNPRMGCGLYELETGCTVNNGPVWSARDGNRLARCPNGVWVAQHEENIGRNKLLLKLLATGSPPCPCDWGEWQAPVGGVWTSQREIQCVSPPRPRFPVGARVGCCCGGGFQSGTVVKHHYRCAPPWVGLCTPVA